MKFYVLALKRYLTPSFIVLLALLSGLIFLSGKVDLVSRRLPCALLDEDDSSASRKIVSALSEEDFVLCRSRAKLYEIVREGEADCGVILLQGLEDAIQNGETQQLVHVVSTSMSFLDDIYKAQVMAEVLSAAAPALTYSVTDELGWLVSYEEIKSTYDSMMENNTDLKFLFETVNGEYISGGDYGEELRMLVAGILAFTLSFVAALRKTISVRKLSGVISIGEMAKSVILPQSVVCSVLCSVAAIVGFWGELDMALAVSALCFAAVGFGVLFAFILSEAASYCVLIIWVMAAIALSPVYMDISAFLPFAAYLRIFIPTCWIFIIENSGPIWLLGSAAFMTAASYISSALLHRLQRERQVIR